MAKKFNQYALNIKILTPESEERIEELINLGLITLDSEIEKALLQLEELKESATKDREFLNLLIKKTQLETLELKKEIKKNRKAFEKAIELENLERLEELNWVNKNNKDVN